MDNLCEFKTYQKGSKKQDKDYITHGGLLPVRSTLPGAAENLVGALIFFVEPPRPDVSTILSMTFVIIKFD